MITHDAFFIGGRWVKPHGDDSFAVISPSTEQAVALVPVATDADIDDAVSAAKQAFERGDWAHLKPHERADIVEGLADILAPRVDELVGVQVDEMGGTVSWITALTSAVTGATLRHECQLARQFEWEKIESTFVGDVLVRQEPVGVVGAIIPWNGPIGLSMKKLLPSLLSGSSIVLKPPPESPLDSYILAEACESAGIPEGVVSVIPGGRDVGARLVEHPDVDLVSMTGGSAAGKHIASIAGAQMKRTVLELGGKSAGIVLEDADLDQSLEHLVRGSLQNNAQACVAISRLLLPRARYEEFVDAFCAAVAALKVGDPHDTDTYFGPLVSQRQRERVEGYIRSGRESGATVALGGGRPSGLDRGWYVEPTVFVDVSNDMAIAREEIFGPVVCMIPYDTEEEAVAIANDSPFGLSGAVFTTDPARGLRVAERVRTGAFSVGEYKIPFGSPTGGFKESGVGRETLRYYTETKSISLPSGFSAGGNR